MTPFKFLQPEPYLMAWMKARSRRGHPLRPWIAAQMGWSPGRISRVLTGKGKITPVEARRISLLLKHEPAEAAYYLAMTHWNWAARTETRVRYWDEMEQIRTAREEGSQPAVTRATAPT